MLKDIKEIWGIPMETILKSGRKYNIISWVIYVIDVCLVILCGVYMFSHNSSFNSYIFAVFFLAILSYFLSSLFVDKSIIRAYKFLSKFNNANVLSIKTYVKAENLKSIIYCSNYKRRKDNGTIDEYKEMILSACCEDDMYSHRIGTMLSKFTINFDSSEEVNVLMVNKGRRYYVVGFDD